MKRLMLVAVIALLASGVSSATIVTCGVPGAQDVLAVGFQCGYGGLLFSNFNVVAATPGLVPSMTLVTASIVDSYVDLRFNPSLSTPTPPPILSSDIWFYYTVTGGVNGIDLAVGGYGANVDEIACSAPVTADNICPEGTLLGSVIATSGHTDHWMFAGGKTFSPIYIFKDILVQADSTHIGELSTFTESFHIPEPISLVLIGSGLLGLGLLRRRARS